MSSLSLVEIEREQLVHQSVPAGWNISKVKYLANYINGYAFKPEDWGDEGKPILRIQNLTDSDAALNRYNGELPQEYLVRHGDILISWSASLRVFKWYGEDAWLNQHIFKAEVNEKLVRRDYFVWLANWFMNELAERAHGSTMQHLTKDAFGSFPVFLPPLNEQMIIADFLDRETAQIDTLISAKKDMLELLTEKRRAIVTQVVTHGLNPNVSMRDSGVEWLREIPAHWEIEFAGRLIREIDSRSTTGEEELLTVSHITGVTPRSEKDVNMFMAESMEGYKICKKGDLVINTLWAWMGAMGIAFQEGIVSPSYHVYRSMGRYEPKYLDYLVRIPNFTKEVLRYSRGVWSSRLRLYPEEFYKIQLPVPPLEEQQEIIEYLDKQTAQIDNFHNALKKTITLLQERRAALIAAAVTGKIRVPVEYEA